MPEIDEFGLEKPGKSAEYLAWEKAFIKEKKPDVSISIKLTNSNLKKLRDELNDLNFYAKKEDQISLDELINRIIDRNYKRII